MAADRDTDLVQAEHSVEQVADPAVDQCHGPVEAVDEMFSG